MLYEKEKKGEGAIEHIQEMLTHKIERNILQNKNKT